MSWSFKLAGRRDEIFTRTRYIYRRGDYVGLNRYFFNTVWDSLLASNDVQQQYDTFLETLNNGIKKFIPISNRNNNRPLEPWINKNIIKLSSKKRRTWFRFLASSRSKSSFLWLEYNKISKKLKKETKLAIKNYEMMLAKDKKNPKRLFQYVNKRHAVTSNISALRNSEGEVVTNGTEVCNILNNFFKSVFIEEKSDILPDFNHRVDVPHPMDSSLSISP